MLYIFTYCFAKSKFDLFMIIKNETYFRRNFIIHAVIDQVACGTLFNLLH